MPQSKPKKLKAIFLAALVLAAAMAVTLTGGASASPSSDPPGKLPDHDPHASLRVEDSWHKIHFTLYPFDPFSRGHILYQCSGDAFGRANEGSCEGYVEKSGSDPFPIDQQAMFRWDPWHRDGDHPRRLMITIRANRDRIYGVINGPDDPNLYYSDAYGPYRDLPRSEFLNNKGNMMVLRNPDTEWPVDYHGPPENWKTPGQRGGPLKIDVFKAWVKELDLYAIDVEGYLFW